MSQEHSTCIYSAYFLQHSLQWSFFKSWTLQNTYTSEVSSKSCKELILLGLPDYYKVSDWEDMKILEVIYYRLLFINIAGEHEFLPSPIFPLTETTLSPLYP